jgi:hypothetical protein
MRFSRSTSTCKVSLLTAAIILCLGQAFAQGGERGRSIEFSKTRSSEVATNLNQLSNKKEGLREFEEDLFKPFQVITPKSSLDGVLAPPVRSSAPAISSKKARELLKKKREWIYDTQAEMPNDSTFEEILNAPDFTDDGKDKRKLSPLDKYFDYLETKRKAGIAADKDKEDPLARLRRQAQGLPADSKDDEDNSPKAEEDKESSTGLKALFKPDLSASPFAPKKPSSGFSDIFGLDRFRPTPEQDKEHREYMRQYQQLLGSSPIPGSLQPAAPASPSIDVRSPVTFPGADPFALQRPAPVPVTTLPNVQSSLTDTKTFNTLPAYTPPVVQDSPKPLFPASPFEAPRRKF